MALQESPIEYFFTVKDRGGDTVQLRFKSNGDSVVTAANLFTNIRSALAAITSAKIIKAGYSYLLNEDDDSVTVNNGEVGVKAVITCSLVRETPPAPGQTKFANITIPAPVDAMFTAQTGPGYNVVNTAYAPLQTFLTLFTEGLGLLPSLVLSDGQTIADPTVASNVKGIRAPKRNR